MKEHKIGETFRYGDALLKVVEDLDNICAGCFFECPSNCSRPLQNVEYCSKANREDGKNVIFKEVTSTIEDTANSAVSSAVNNVDFAYIIAHRTNDGEVVINTIGKPENICQLKKQLQKILE